MRVFNVGQDYLILFILMISMSNCQTDRADPNLERSSDLILYLPFSGIYRNEISGSNAIALDTSNSVALDTNLRITNFKNITLTVDRLGRANQAVYFTGKTCLGFPYFSDLINYKATSLKYCTIAFWIKAEPNQISSYGLNYLIKIGNARSSNIITSVYLNPIGSIKTALGSYNYFYDQRNQPLYYGYPPTDFSKYLNRFVHVCLTYEGTIVRLYLDGEVVGQQKIYFTDFTNPDSITSPMFIIGERFKGTLDEIRIYKRVLDKKEVVKLTSL